MNLCYFLFSYFQYLYQLMQKYVKVNLLSYYIEPILVTVKDKI